MREAPRQYRGLTVSIFAGAFVFGIVMSSLGALLPALFTAVGFEKADAGGLFLVMNFSMLVASLVFGPVCDRFGFRALLLVSTVLVGGAFLALSRATGYGHLIAGLATLGLGGGGLNGGTNALLNDISPERRASALNMLGIFFGVGALLMPFLTGSLMAAFGLDGILHALVALTLAPLVLFALADFPTAKMQGGFNRTQLRRVLGSPILYLFGFLLFFQSGNEFTIGGWLSTYLGDQMGMAASAAAYVLAGYWAAVMAGRLAASRLAGRIEGPVLVAMSSALAGVAALGLVLAPGAVSAVLFATLVGLGFAAVFPTVLAQAGGVFAELSGTAFSVIFVMALSGGMTAPWLAGRIAQNSGVGAAFWLTVTSCAAIVVLQFILRSRMRAKTSPGA